MTFPAPVSELPGSLPPNLGSSEGELYLSACSDPGSVPSSALGQWLSQCPACCLSFPLHLRVIFPAFKRKLLRAGTGSHTSQSLAPLCPREGSSVALPCAPRLGGSWVRNFGCAWGGKRWAQAQGKRTDLLGLQRSRGGWWFWGALGLLPFLERAREGAK